jgi:hypothetical protein
MTHQVAFVANVEVDVEKDELKVAALEGYKAFMEATSDNKTHVTLSVRDQAGIMHEVTLDRDEADEYAGVTLPGLMIG